MDNIKINLGKGVGKGTHNLAYEKEFTSNLINVWKTIEDFGIDPSDLKAVDPSQKDLYEIYAAIKAYRISIRYLKMLKSKMGGKSIG